MTDPGRDLRYSVRQFRRTRFPRSAGREIVIRASRSRLIRTMLLNEEDRQVIRTLVALMRERKRH